MHKSVLRYCLLTSLLLTGLSAFLTLSYAVDEATLWIDPSTIRDTTYIPSTTLTFRVCIANISDLHSLSLNVSFDSAILGYSSHSIGALNHLPTPRWVVNDEIGFIWFNVRYDAPISTASPLMLLNITIRVRARGETIMDLHDTSLLDSNGAAIVHMAFDGYFSNCSPYDITRDGKIDIRDVATVAHAFGSYPGHPRWNPDADVNDDGKVDIKDVALVAAHFGQN